MAYLGHILNIEIYSSSIESIIMVSLFREVFHTTFLCMPPDRDIDICIDFYPGIHPISNPPYPMAPIELNRKALILELVDKYFIRPSVSSGVMMLCCFFMKNNGSMRMSIDYLQLNIVTILNMYMLPQIFYPFD